jgi:hypothetical protein
MKFKVYNTQTVIRGGRETKPFISFSIKTGLISINKTAIILLGIKKGDKIQFLQDPDDLTNWFVQIVKENGFITRHNSSGDMLELSCKKIANEIHETVGKPDKIRIRVPLAPSTNIDGLELFPLITLAAK